MLAEKDLDPILGPLENDLAALMATPTSDRSDSKDCAFSELPLVLRFHRATEDVLGTNTASLMAEKLAIHH